MFDIGVRHAHSLVSEFLDHQFGGIGVDGLVHRHHHAHLHQGLDHVGGTFGHPVGQFLHDNGFRQLHVAHLLFGLLAKAKRLCAGAFLLALHRGHGALAPAAFARQRRVQRQLARAAASAIVAGLALVAVVAFPVGLARGGNPTTTDRATISRAFLGLCGRRSGGRSSGFLGLFCLRRFLGLAGLFLGLGLQLGLALALLAFALLNFGAAAFAVFLARLLIGQARGGFFDLTRFGGADRSKAAFQLGLGNPGGTTTRVAALRVLLGFIVHGGSLGARFWHEDALALGFHNHRLGPAMAEALLHLTRSSS